MALSSRLTIAAAALVVIALAAATTVAGPRSRPAREVAITFDDLPAVSVAGGGNVADARGQDAAWKSMTERLVGELVAARVPVVGFVNSGKLWRDGTLVPARLDLLRAWRDAGFELGNHTASHVDRHTVPLAEYEADVVRGEAEIRTLLEEGAPRASLRWFRHPYLHTGRTLEERRALDEFLSSRGYRVAPVTIDNSEWIFARAYQRALDAGDRTLASRVRSSYVPYMEAQFDYLERQSRALFGREIRQVLLVHANSLNADAFETLLARLRRRGYAFVSLDHALEDPAYASTDTFVGSGGITWLHRWAISSGARPLPGEPQPEAFVFRAANVEPGS